jgi:putative transposase
MSHEMTAPPVTDALIMAILRRGPPGDRLVHSDQGSQYASESYQALLTEFGITCNMSRRGDVWDNSAMESFILSLQTERTSRPHHRTRNQTRADVCDYFERLYNVRRRHSAIGDLSPAESESIAATI